MDTSHTAKSERRRKKDRGGEDRINVTPGGTWLTVIETGEIWEGAFRARFRGRVKVSTRELKKTLSGSETKN